MMKAEKNKILIVDDEPDVIEFLSYNFRKSGYEVMGADNGAEGIEKVKSYNPDLIIADIMMPNMDGIVMCKILKNSDHHKNTPLIFLSATQDNHQVMNAGMSGNEYLSKPIKFSVLLSVVKKHLSNNNLQIENA